MRMLSWRGQRTQPCGTPYVGFFCPDSWSESLNNLSVLFLFSFFVGCFLGFFFKTLNNRWIFFSFSTSSADVTSEHEQKEAIKSNQREAHSVNMGPRCRYFPVELLIELMLVESSFCSDQAQMMDEVPSDTSILTGLLISQVVATPCTS